MCTLFGMKIVRPIMGLPDRNFGTYGINELV